MTSKKSKNKNQEGFPDLKSQVIEQLKTVIDPEIGIDIYTLGLIYDIKIEKKNVNIRMTFTTPACPYGPMLLEEIKIKMNELEIDEVNIDLTFNPPWEPSAELRALLGV